MTRTLVKPRLFSNKIKQKPKPQKENNTTTLPTNLQSFKRNSYQEVALLNTNSVFHI